MYQKRYLINIPNLDKILDEYSHIISSITESNCYQYFVDELLTMSLKFACNTISYNEPYPIVTDNWSGSISKQSLSGDVYDFVHTLADEGLEDDPFISDENFRKLANTMEHYSYIVANKIYASIFLGMSSVDYNNLYNEMDFEYMDRVNGTDCIIIYTFGY